jgi:hypothetical protein
MVTESAERSAWHKLWFGQGNSLFVPMPGKATPEQLLALQRRGETAGLPNVVGNGQGFTMTRFYPPTISAPYFAAANLRPTSGQSRSSLTGWQCARPNPAWRGRLSR